MAGKNGRNDDTRITMKHDGQTVETTVGRIREVAAHTMFPFPIPDEVFPKDSKPTLVVADALEEVVARLLEECEEFEELDGSRIRVLYKKGTPDWYARTKVKGEEDVLLSHVDAVILVALERCYATQLTYRQVEALLHQQLCHLQADDGKLKTRSPDVVGFEKNVERYGAWLPAFRRFEEQLRLFDEATAPATASGLKGSAEPEPLATGVS